jgi:hypothetical protein
VPADFGLVGSTFSIAATTAAVPEPASLALLGSGLMVFVAGRYRLRK